MTVGFQLRFTDSGYAFGPPPNPFFSHSTATAHVTVKVFVADDDGGRVLASWNNPPGRPCTRSKTGFGGVNGRPRHRIGGSAPSQRRTTAHDDVSGRHRSWLTGDLKEAGWEAGTQGVRPAQAASQPSVQSSGSPSGFQFHLTDDSATHEATMATPPVLADSLTLSGATVGRCGTEMVICGGGRAGWAPQPAYRRPGSPSAAPDP